jgi:hypothetical protein
MYDVFQRMLCSLAEITHIFNEPPAYSPGYKILLVKKVSAVTEIKGSSPSTNMRLDYYTPVQWNTNFIPPTSLIAIALLPMLYLPGGVLP